MSWGLFEGWGSNDVMPIDDISEHIAGEYCPCKPILYHGAVDLVIHNAFDCRELIEQAEDIINKRKGER